MGYVRWIENKLKQPAYTPAGAASARAALRFWRGAPFYAPHAARKAAGRGR